MAPKKNSRVSIYCRVSTSDQDSGMQLRELREYTKNRGLEVVGEFVDTESGAKDSRPELDRLWTAVRGRKVDAVVVWKFDRFARSTKQLVDALEEMNHIGVDFVSLHEQIDTSSPMGKAMFVIVSAIGEFERSLISDRVKSGIAKSRALGRPHGRPGISEKTVTRIKQLRGDKMSIREIAVATGVSKSAVAKYL